MSSWEFWDQLRKQYLLMNINKKLTHFLQDKKKILINNWISYKKIKWYKISGHPSKLGNQNLNNGQFEKNKFKGCSYGFTYQKSKHTDMSSTQLEIVGPTLLVGLYTLYSPNSRLPLAKIVYQYQILCTKNPNSVAKHVSWSIF